VVPLAEFDRLPNTALTLSVPRNAISWKPYAVAGDNPSTVHVRLPPIAFPASGVAQTPRATSGAEPHDSGPTAERTSDRKSVAEGSCAAGSAGVATVSVTTDSATSAC